MFTHGSAEAADARIREFMNGGYRALLELREAGDATAAAAAIEAAFAAARREPVGGGAPA